MKKILLLGLINSYLWLLPNFYIPWGRIRTFYCYLSSIVLLFYDSLLEKFIGLEKDGFVFRTLQPWWIELRCYFFTFAKEYFLTARPDKVLPAASSKVDKEFIINGLIRYY